jgi:hypothetical protein
MTEAELRRHEWRCAQGHSEDCGHERRVTPSGVLLAVICLSSVGATILLVRLGWMVFG